jgi:outer membrane protein TolC
MRFDISRELWPSARRRAERGVADRDVERARIEAEIAERALDALVTQLLVKAGASSAIAARLASEDSLLGGAEEALRARFAVADARYVDVLRLRTERLRVETEIHRSRADARIGRRQLVRLTSASDTLSLASLVDAAVAVEARNFLRGTVPPLPSLDSLLAVSGALPLAQLSVDRARAMRALVIAEQRPVVAASLGVQRFVDDLGGANLGLTAGLSIPLSFTARRANAARKLVAEREVSLAQAERAAIETRVSSALAAAADRYETARAQIAAYDAALLRGAREERETALAAYRANTMTLIELLDFERALAQAEVSRMRSQAEAADALLDLLNSVLGADDLPDVAPRDRQAGGER